MGKIEEVKKGSLLTAEKMNEMIRILNRLQRKVESLEKRVSGLENVPPGAML
jgi:hypothetical protein